MRQGLGSCCSTCEGDAGDLTTSWTWFHTAACSCSAHIQWTCRLYVVYDSSIYSPSLLRCTSWVLSIRCHMGGQARAFEWWDAWGMAALQKNKIQQDATTGNNIKYIQKLSAGHTAVMGDDNPLFSVYSKPTMIYCNPPRIPKTSRPVTSLSQQCPHPLKCSSLRVMEASRQCWVYRLHAGGFVIHVYIYIYKYIYIHIYIYV